jgi:hypothetical protein
MLARWGMLTLLSLVLWGTLWDAALLWTWLNQGTAAVAVVILRPPVAHSAAAWGNRLCGLLAVLAWVVFLGARWSSPRRSA